MVFCVNAKASAKYGKRGETLYCIQDATIAAAYSQLAATALGFSSVWVGSFDEEEAKRVLKTDLRPVAIICFGYPDESPYATPRKSLDEVFEEI